MERALPLPIRGLFIGFTIAAAVDPISLLVIRRTIEHGGIYGFASGLGVATADASFGAIAAFGLVAVTSVLVSGKLVLGLVGGVINRAARNPDDAEPSGRGRARRRPTRAPRCCRLDLRADDDQPDDDPVVRRGVRGTRLAVAVALA